MRADAAIPFDPTTPEQRADLFDVLALARREEPVFHAPALDIGSHVAFGKGIHFCIGAPLGRLELRAALPLLLRRLPKLRPGPGRPSRDAVFFARGFTSLDAEWDP